MGHERHTAAFVVGIALGGLTGAGYVLFKTPRSGREIRDGIAARVQSILATVKETAGVIGVETRRAGEQTVGRIEATGAAVRDRLPLPGPAGVADLVPGRVPPDPASVPTAATVAATPPADAGPPDSLGSDPARVSAADQSVASAAAFRPPPAVSVPASGDGGRRAASEDATRAGG